MPHFPKPMTIPQYLVLSNLVCFFQNYFDVNPATWNCTDTDWGWCLKPPIHKTSYLALTDKQMCNRIRCRLIDVSLAFRLLEQDAAMNIGTLYRSGSTAGTKSRGAPVFLYI